jgi:hypothetical protein
VVGLQTVGGFGPLAAGLSLMPVTVLMLLFSGRSGALAARAGPRLPMTLGTLVAAVGVAGLTRIAPGATYLRDVLAPVVLLGIGLTLAVTPLTAAVLDALPDELSGIASGVNNAVARTGGLLSVAALPLLTGLSQGGFASPGMAEPFHRAMWWCAGFLAAGSLLSFLLVREQRPLAAPEPAEPVPERMPRAAPATVGASRTASYSCGVCGPPAAAEPVEHP